jgi:hypothetical protein
MENNQIDELALAELKFLLKKHGMEKNKALETQETKDMVNHPAHYGGDNPMEVIKIINHYNLGFELGNVAKYVLRSDKKGNKLEDLKKAAWYLQHEIKKLENV